MAPELSKRIQKVKPSPTLEVTKKAAELRAAGMDVISLGAGEPDFDTPDHIKAAAIDAIKSGFTKYTVVDGIPELKQAIKDKFWRDNKLNYQPKQILVSTGCKQSIYNLCQAIIDDGDEVIIPAPFWVSYPDIVLLAGGKPVIIPSTLKNSYKITPEQLNRAITPKTKLLFLNSPSNPSGIAYNIKELTAIAEVLKQHPSIYIASDDIYEHIIWTQPFVNILNVCEELYQRTIIVNGVSKAYAMTGWRIGYAGGPEAIINAMSIIQSQSTSNPCSIAQKAAVAALNGPQEIINDMVSTYRKRHDYIIGRLSDIPRMKFIPADGTFYIFPDISEIIENLGYASDIEFAEKLLQQVGLAIVPGSAFGNDGCIRLSFSYDLESLRDALDRLQHFCNL